MILTLATTDRLDTSHHGLVHGARRKNFGSLQSGTTALSGLNGALAANGITECVNNATKECRTDWNIDDLASALGAATLLDEMVVTENQDTDIVGLQVQAHSTSTRGELHPFLR
jgi:hypothetical protein